MNDSFVSVSNCKLTTNKKGDAMIQQFINETDNQLNPKEESMKIEKGAAPGSVIPVPIERTPVSNSDFALKISLNNAGNSFRNDTGDFRRLEVKNLALAGEMLGRIEADFSSFSDCSFTDCDLRNASFKHAELKNVTFTRCHLQGAEFHFAKLDDVRLEECDADNLEFHFVSGKVTVNSTGMRGWELPMSAIALKLTKCSAIRMECNDSTLELEASGSNFGRSEFNNTVISGEVRSCNFTNAEFNGANIANLTRIASRFDNIEKENAVGFGANSDDDDDFFMDFEDTLEDVEEPDGEPVSVDSDIKNAEEDFSALL